MPGRAGDDHRVVAPLPQLPLGVQQHGEGAVVQLGVVVHPQVVVVVAGHGGGEGAPHASVPVQLAVALQQGDLGELLGDRRGGAIAAGVVEREGVDRYAWHLLVAQRAQTGQGEVPTVVGRQDRGDPSGGASFLSQASSSSSTATR
jgi:hypothetical protein